MMLINFNINDIFRFFNDDEVFVSSMDFVELNYIWFILEEK